MPNKYLIMQFSLNFNTYTDSTYFGHEKDT